MDSFKKSDPRLYEVVTFIDKLQKTPTPTTDPRNVKLPAGFSVCVIGASGEGIGENIAYAFAHAGASEITIAARNPMGLEPVVANIKSISPTTTVHAHACDVTSIDSVSGLAASINNGLDCVITNPAYAYKYTDSIVKDPADGYTQTYLTNVVGTLHVAKSFIPVLLAKQDGAKALISISSIGSCLTQGFGVQIAYNISKLAQTRTMEQLSYMHEKDGLFALSVHPGAVATKQAKKLVPEEYHGILADDPALCGAVCVWLTKDAVEKRKWLNGRFVSSCWDMDEFEKRREEIVKGDLLKWGLNT